MPLFERLQEDLKSAMRAGDTTTRDTLRMAIAACKNRRIELGEELDDPEVLAVLGKQVKSRQDSVDQYESAGREDLASKERAEIEVLRRYLPRELSEDETRELVRSTIESLGVTEKSELGRVMKEVMATHRGTVDGKRVQSIAAELLG